MFTLFSATEREKLRVTVDARRRPGVFGGWDASRVRIVRVIVDKGRQLGVFHEYGLLGNFRKRGGNEPARGVSA